MRTRPFWSATHGAMLLFLLGLAPSEVHADPIQPVTYSATNVTSLNPTGFDQAGSPFNEYQNPPLPVSNTLSLPGYDLTTVVGSNAAGQEIGASFSDLTSTGWLNNAGWIYSGGQFTILPFAQSAPTAINASGQVVGNEFDNSGSHAFLYSIGHIAQLGTLGGASSGATSLNDQGQVVGWANVACAPGTPSYAQTSRAFLYENGQMYDLNNLLSKGTPPLDLGLALGINNMGQILAAGDSQVYLLTPTDMPAPPPIPEASTLAFACIAIAALRVRRIFGKWPNRKPTS
jgi:probable HAF family extracellular repeat protein